MSMTHSSATNWLKLLFQNIAWAGIGDVAGLLGSAAPGVLYVSLHTADPGIDGSQTTNETAYPNYLRVPVVRSALGWTVGVDVVENAAEVAFPKCGAGASAITHFAVGKSAAGAGEIIGRGACVLAVGENVIPTFAAGELEATAS